MTDAPAAAEQEEMLRRFFHERLVPAAKAMRARGAAPLARVDNSAASMHEKLRTYYTSRSETTTRVADGASLDHSRLAGELRAMWAGAPELLALVDPLVELAAAMGRGDDGGGDVSTLIYAMY
ncbi:MAG: hypothetical protein M3081_16955 [Gemmatimonadota bacterium]|nr:hypothetical protein [Gemmatimonadota bacterium]